MNGSAQCSRVKPNVVKPLVLAVALTLPGIPAFAESGNDVVSTPAEQIIDQQHGRDSVYAIQAFSRYSERMTAEQSSAQLSNLLGKTKSFAVATWDKTTSVLRQEGTVSPNEPQRYGRAGGLVGPEQHS